MQKKDARQRQQFEDRVPPFLDFHQKCTRCCNSRSSAWVRSDIPASKGINLLPDTKRARDVCSTQLRLLGQRSGPDSQQEGSPKRSGQHTLLVLFMNIQYLFQSFCQSTVRGDHKPLYSLKVEYIHQKIVKYSQFLLREV